MTFISFKIDMIHLLCLWFGGVLISPVVDISSRLLLLCYFSLELQNFFNDVGLISFILLNLLDASLFVA